MSEEQLNIETEIRVMAEIFNQLQHIPTFVEYFSTHFDVKIDIDEETNVITKVNVRPVSIEETQKRMLTLAKEKSEGIIAPEPEIYTG